MSTVTDTAGLAGPTTAANTKVEHDFIVVLTAHTDPSTSRDAAREGVYDALGTITSSRITAAPLTWWHADDDRTDGSDRDSVMFVDKGEQVASHLLHGLTTAQRDTLAAVLGDAIAYYVGDADPEDMDPHDAEQVAAARALADVLGIEPTP